MENWKDIKGYEGLYQVSDEGRVKRLSTYQIMHWLGGQKRLIKERVLSQSKKDGKYCVVSFSKENNIKQKYVHRLVAEQFISDIPKGMAVNHKDKNIDNNALENLEIISYRDNSIHAHKARKTSSKYPCVSWNKARKKWVAIIKVKKESFYLGGYTNEKDAYKAVLGEFDKRGFDLKYA